MLALSSRPWCWISPLKGKLEGEKAAATVLLGIAFKPRMSQVCTGGQTSLSRQLGVSLWQSHEAHHAENHRTKIKAVLCWRGWLTGLATSPPCSFSPLPALPACTQLSAQPETQPHGHAELGLLGSPFHFSNPAQSPFPPPSLPFPQGTLLYPPICSHS